MTYIDLDGTVHDTKTAPIKKLFGLLKFLKKSPMARLWLLRNGPDPTRVLKNICTAIRWRVQVDHEAMPRFYQAILVQMDPPACRCGRPGTRIIGHETFCLRCGPTAEAQRRDAYRIAKGTGASVAIEQRMNTKDTRLRLADARSASRKAVRKRL